MTIDIAAPGSDAEALVAALLALVPPARMPMVSGRAYGVDNVVYVAQAPDAGDDYIYAIPIYISAQVTVESMSIYVATPADATAQNARVGIAVDDGGKPSATLIAEGNTELDLTQAGALTAALTAAECSVGWHWLLYWASAPTGGNAAAAILHCIDGTTKLCGTSFHIGATAAGEPTPAAALGTEFGWLGAGLTGFADYETNASLQAAVTDVSPIEEANTGGLYFPGIAITIA